MRALPLFALPLALACGTPYAYGTGAQLDSGLGAAADGVCPDPGGLPYLAPLPPDVLLVVDRSGSMAPHWEDLLALTPYIQGMGAMTRPGLALFPQPAMCLVDDALRIAPGVGTADAILAEIAATWPGGSTPIAGVLDQLRSEGLLQDPDRENVLIFVGDGASTCPGDSVAAVRAWGALPVPVKMHFIAFAAPEDAQGELEAMAEAADGAYYPADDISELAERLDRVVASMAPCSFALDEPVPAVEVALDGAPLPACADASCTDGYFYDPDLGVVSLARDTCMVVAPQACPDVVITEG